MSSTSRAQTLKAAQTLLFAPGHRPNVVHKALASPADLVVIDLEDAVPAEHRGLALDTAVLHAADGRVLVRINGPVFDNSHAELAALAPLGAVVMVPKATLAGVRALVASWPGVAMVALIETAEGLLDVREIARDPSVARLCFGHLDLAAELGISPRERTVMASARIDLVVASAAAGLPGPIDGVTETIHDPQQIARDVDAARGIGFTGKLLIHPTQITPTRDSFRPAPEEVEWATRVASSLGLGATDVDGSMVDEPVVLRARKILSSAERS